MHKCISAAVILGRGGKLGSRVSLLLSFLLLSALVLWAGLWAVEESPVVEPVLADPTGQPLQAPWNFTVVALPDTQFYSQSYPAIFTNQTQWIVNSAASLNTVFVTHEGDLVNTYSSGTQWNSANVSMSKLDGNVPYAVLPGNHDGLNVGGTGENLDNYNTYFPISRFSGESWYGGACNNVNSNSFELFSGGADDYLIFHFQYHPSDAILAWANTTIANYPGRRVIVTTHDYMNVDGSRSTEGNHIWNSFVVAHADQVFLVLCGHNHGEARRTDTVNEHVVYQLLADYQEGYPSGGNGWLRILNFHPAEDKIYVKTFSPYVNQYQADADSQFTLEYDMTSTQPLAISLQSPENATTTVDNMPDFKFIATNPNQLTFDCFLWLQNGTSSNVCATKTGIANGSLATLTPSSPVPNGVWQWWINCTAGILSGVSEKRSITIEVFRGDKTFTSSWDGTTRTYWLDIPDNFDISAPMPLVFFLHGYGASRYRYSDPTYAPEMRKVFQNHTWIVAAVECRESPGDDDDWYVEPSRRDITDISTQLENSYNIDLRHVHVMGNSMGGGGALKYAMFNNQVVASLVDIHGITNFTQFYYESSTFRASLVAAYGGTPSQVPAVYANESALGNEQRFSHTAVMMLHGTADSTVRVSHSRNLNQSLSALGYTVKYIEVPGVGHDAPTLINGREMEIFGWLSSHPLVEYTLTINVAGEGSVTLDPGEPTYSPGTKVSLSAVPAAGWSFSAWSGDASGSANPTTVTMDGNKAVTATFVAQQGPVVNYVAVWSFADHDWVSEGGLVNSGYTIRIYAGISNPVEPVSISYGPTGSLAKVTALYESTWEYYYFDWVIPSGAALGLYDVKVDSGVTSVTATGRFQVGASVPVVNYVAVWSYADHDWISEGGMVNSGRTVRIYAAISNPVEPVSISYGPTGSLTTVTALYEFTWDYYYFDWVIPSDATTGLYDVQVESGVASFTATGRFQVGASVPVVNYVAVWSYSDHDWISDGGTVTRGHTVRIYAGISNPVVPVSISYGPSGGSLTKVTALYESTWDYYYFDWAIPYDATLGAYDVKVETGGVETTSVGRFQLES